MGGKPTKPSKKTGKESFSGRQTTTEHTTENQEGPLQWEDLQEGDQVYYYMSGICGALTHHGIVVRVGTSKEDIRIVDFGTDHTRANNMNRIIREAPLDSFLPEGKSLRRVAYGAPYASLDGVSSFTETESDLQVVLQRARRLCMLGDIGYDIYRQSCQTVAFWCKTGNRHARVGTGNDAIIRRPLETINRITQLHSRDRNDMARMRDPYFDRPSVNNLATELDDFVTTLEDENLPRVNCMELPRIVAESFQLHFGPFVEEESQECHNSAENDTVLERLQISFAVQVLLRCDRFHAILDLPENKENDDTDHQENDGVRVVIDMLKAAEFAILRRRFVSLEDFTCAVHYPITNDLLEFTVRACQYLLRNHQEHWVTLESFQRSEDVRRLDQSLRELHPHRNPVPVPSMEDHRNYSFKSYLEQWIQWSEYPNDEEEGDTQEYYRMLLEAVETRAQLVAFLSTSSTEALQVANRIGRKHSRIRRASSHSQILGPHAKSPG